MLEHDIINDVIVAGTTWNVDKIKCEVFLWDLENKRHNESAANSFSDLASYIYLQLKRITPLNST